MKRKRTKRVVLMQTSEAFGDFGSLGRDENRLSLAVSLHRGGLRVYFSSCEFFPQAVFDLETCLSVA